MRTDRRPGGGAICRQLLHSILACALFLWAAAAQSQHNGSPADTTTVSDVAELLLDSIEHSESDSSDLLELLGDLADRLVDLNQATVPDLLAIPGISPQIARAIVDHRDSTGSFASVVEVMEVPGVTPDVYRYLKPFVRVDAPPDPRSQARVRSPKTGGRIRVDVLQRVQRRLQLARGYQPVDDSLLHSGDAPTRYLGRPERIYTRLRADLDRVYSLNLTLEKDPGEPFDWDPSRGTYGYDFVSWHIASREVGPFQSIIAGDFVAEFGQGLTLWRASGFGKGRDPVRPLVRQGRGLRPYGSTDENRFFRGLAAEIALTPAITVSGFASRRHYDARFTLIDTSGVAAATGLPTSGLHRTPSEIAARRALGQTLVGAATELRLGRGNLGAAGYTASFDAPLQAGDRAFQRFQFSGDRASMLGAFGSYHAGVHYFFGEVARDPGGSFGGIGGIEAEYGNLQALVLLRHYPRDFTSLHGYAFGDRNGATQNETGVYVGVRARPAPRLLVSGYVDQFRSPWVRYRIPWPSSGHDVMASFEYRPRSWLTLHGHVRRQERDVGLRLTTPTGSELETTEPEARQTIRLQADYLAGAALRLRSRIELSGYRRGDRPADHGVLLFHDVRWQSTATLRLDGRITYFDTDGFGARIYQFENDLLGVLTNAMLYGRGVRSYILLDYRPRGWLRGVNARLKLAGTAFRDRYAIGSGLEQIDGNRVHDLGLQLRYRVGG